ncbi:HDOD domain-containing protein [Photobacterium halotolerans]|uniref:HDOD domain-containing protein n=1 Tax=Photobacterium halotolerans TaxID=265726 RepID=A0A7X4WEG4_9GAMM|nr:HDOD domain-containing protein [Photobacterium halotolerans]NAW67198.1 HDOD domain-containing protein [Photobacterium halotolerans]NAW85138.1 HDOD domain-containing protein [Photobacterium halotolerans]
MPHVSFFWLKPENDKILTGLQSEFHALVKDAIKENRLKLPPIPDVLTELQTLCNRDDSTVRDAATILLNDPGMAATVIKTSNTMMFNRRNIVCHDIQTAVSRLGIIRVRDIITAKTVLDIKLHSSFDIECKSLLLNSATRSRQLAGSMALITQNLLQYRPELKIEPEKALLAGLFADIGLFSLIHEYQSYLDSGNFLDINFAKYVFEHCCNKSSLDILKHWGFDEDYLEVACNKCFFPDHKKEDDITYLDVARMANHLLLFKNDDDAIDEHEVELDLAGAEVMFTLTNLPDDEFNSQINHVLLSSGF